MRNIDLYGQLDKTRTLELELELEECALLDTVSDIPTTCWARLLLLVRKVPYKD